MLKKYETVLVDKLPNADEIKKNVIYFSERHERSTHLCPCDCGAEVLLSHYRGGWKYYFDQKNQITISTRIDNEDCDTYYTINSGYAFSEV